MYVLNPLCQVVIIHSPVIKFGIRKGDGCSSSFPYICQFTTISWKKRREEPLTTININLAKMLFLAGLVHILVLLLNYTLLLL